MGRVGRGSSAMTGKNTPFGDQPIRAVVLRRHWNLRLIAYETGVAYSHLTNAANGPERGVNAMPFGETARFPALHVLVSQILAAKHP